MKCVTAFTDVATHGNGFFGFFFLSEFVKHLGAPVANSGIVSILAYVSFIVPTSLAFFTLGRIDLN